MGTTRATSCEVSYPFRPRSTKQLTPGQFWAVPLPDGRFACGRVLQIGGSEIPTPTRAFFGGLHDWTDVKAPTADDIVGSRLIRVGIMHIKAITETGGQIIGQRSIELDGIELPVLLSAHGGPGTMLLSGADVIRPARPDEIGRFPVLGVWGYDFIKQLAIHHLT